MRVLKLILLSLLSLFTISCMISAEDLGASFTSPSLKVNATVQEITEEGQSSSVVINDLSTEASTAYIVWSDSHKDKISSLGDYDYTYPEPGIHSIQVELIDRFGNTTLQTIGTTEVSLWVGNAPGSFDFFEPYAWRDAWTSPGLKITHKSNYTDNNEVWSDVTLEGWDSWKLEGQDISTGLLGVSGQTKSSGSFYQQMDGTEALRFSLKRAAHSVEIKFNDLWANEKPTYHEAVRVQLFNEAEDLVLEKIFAGDDDGIVLASLQSESSFSTIVLTVGAYSGGNFQYGWYVNDSLEGVSTLPDEGSEISVASLKVGYSKAE